MNNFTKSKSLIKFNNPFVIGKEIGDICKTIDKKELTGPENYIKKCEKLIMKQLDCKKALLTSSATDALEMACILSNFKQDDEIIIPSSLMSTDTAMKIIVSKDERRKLLDQGEKYAKLFLTYIEENGD